MDSSLNRQEHHRNYAGPNQAGSVAVANPPGIAIACGGTGGHLFPGIAIAEALQQRRCQVTLLVSRKQIDQQSVRPILAEEVIRLPAVGMGSEPLKTFLSGFWQSFQICRAAFARSKPAAVLAMGGFTSAPPILAAKLRRAFTFLHEANAVPGRANRLLAYGVDQAFVGFPMAAARLCHQDVVLTGTPVRNELTGQDAGASRIALNLDPHRPVVLIMGGSQGASGINHLLIRTLPLLQGRKEIWQFLHLTGTADFELVRAAYVEHRVKATVRPFLTEMDLALGAATAAVSRAGASSLAEFAAALIPAILIPYPHAADNHQFYNARALARTGAAVQLDQATATPRDLMEHLQRLILAGEVRWQMQNALRKWQYPKAAEEIADRMLARMAFGASEAPLCGPREIPIFETHA